MMGNYLSLAAAQSIFAAVAAASDIEVEIIASRSRYTNVISARRAVMKLMRDRSASSEMIGLRMQLDHSTVLHGLKKYECDADAQALVAKVKALS